MRKKTAIIAASLAATALIFWVVTQNRHQHDFEKQAPVIQAVSEIEKNLNEADQNNRKK